MPLYFFKNKKLFLSLILAIILLAALFASCTKRVPEVKEQYFVNILPIPTKPELSALPEHDFGLFEKINEKHILNDDTIGWLNIDGTTLDDEVMYHKNKEDKFYYLRKDFYGNYSFAGTYFLDYRSKFDGGREGLSSNNVIYGHSMTDNPEDTLFSQLKKFKDPDFAKNTPYIKFSTIEDEMIWEVFAIYVTHAKFLYNTPNPKPEALDTVVKTAREKSIYDYEKVEVTSEDKLMTLSTCLYEVNGKAVSYPNNYRYVVMARLVPETEILRKAATIATNENILLPDDLLEAAA